MGREFLFEKVDVDQFKSDGKAWIAEGIDVGNMFKEYQVAVAECVQSEELPLETHVHEILVLSNFLLIKPDQSSALFEKYLPSATTKLIEQKIKEKFNIKKSQLDYNKKAQLDEILSNLRDKSISIKAAST